MAAIKLRLIQEDEVYINFMGDINKGGVSGYETDVQLFNKDGQGWVAEVKFSDMPPQETPEDAIDRLGLYLEAMAKVIKGENISHLNIGALFETVYIQNKK